MKNLITSMACIMILLAFVLQFAQNQVIHNRITTVDQQLNNFKEVVKQDGYITEINEHQLKNRISEIVHCHQGEIMVEGDRNPIFRGNLIHYKVQIPIEGVISIAGFWGISEDKNLFDYQIDRYTTSEYIGRCK